MMQRILKWTLTVLLAALLSLEVASVWYCFSWVKRHDSNVPDGDWCTVAYLDRGAILGGQVGVWEFRIFGLHPPLPEGFAVQHYDTDPATPPARDFAWWSLRREIYPSPFVGPRQSPLTYPILAITLPTAWLWFTDIRRSRRRRRSCCRACGYDLTGLPTGEDGKPTCPECGA